MYSASVTDARIAQRSGFVYCVFAPRLRAAYVGQTWGRTGALGRLAQHLADGGTFRQRLCGNFGYEEVDIGPVVLEAFELDRSRPEFHSEARDHREAVEAVAMFNLLNRIAEDGQSPCVIVSRVRFNPYTRADHVVTTAAKVVDQFYERALALRQGEGWGRA